MGTTAENREGVVLFILEGTGNPRLEISWSAGGESWIGLEEVASSHPPLEEPILETEERDVFHAVPGWNLHQAALQRARNEAWIDFGNLPAHAYADYLAYAYATNREPPVGFLEPHKFAMSVATQEAPSMREKADSFDDTDSGGMTDCSVTSLTDTYLSQSDSD